MEIRMAVAANPKEMASIDVPKSMASAAAADSDGVNAVSPGHGLDLCQDSLMAACVRRFLVVCNLNNLLQGYNMGLVSKFTEDTLWNYHFCSLPVINQES